MRSFLLLSSLGVLSSALPVEQFNPMDFVHEVESVVDSVSRTSRALEPSDDLRRSRSLDSPLTRQSRSPQGAQAGYSSGGNGGGSNGNGNARGGSGNGRNGGGANNEPVQLMPYRFGYAVKDEEGNDFNQQEQSDGQQITGQYSVLLPDGRVQTVTYSVAPNTGFVAEVTYSGGGGGNGGSGGNGGGFGGNGGGFNGSGGNGGGFGGGAQASYGSGK